ncbi:MAG: hypothetical protein K2X03_29890 [Bryobacteraceae bacterium]|nr:hypothetical protein [Bryobacteraceae bacterium]
MTDYTDFDYDALPPVDLDLDLHWIQLPVAVWEAKQAARREALQAAQPEHRIVLACLEPHSEIRRAVSDAVYSALHHSPRLAQPTPSLEK